jgi:4-amino-4-deoxychorismate lyase
MTEQCLVNGLVTHFVDYSDRGFQYGDGVFTTTPVRQGRPALLERHMDRLARDADRLAIEFPHREIVRDLNALLDESSEGILKIQVTRGSGGRGYRMPDIRRTTRVLSVHPPLRLDSQLALRGASTRFCRQRLGCNEALAGVKHMNRLEQILARSEWSDKDIFEGLMLDYEGNLIEGTMTNVFVVKQGVLCTPRLDRCGVEGVMRALVLELAAREGYQACERRMVPEELEAADEIFLTNSVVGVVPVSRVEQETIPVGQITRALQRAVARSLGSDHPPG